MHAKSHIEGLVRELNRFSGYEYVEKVYELLSAYGLLAILQENLPSKTLTDLFQRLHAEDFAPRFNAPGLALVMKGVDYLLDQGKYDELASLESKAKGSIPSYQAVRQVSFSLGVPGARQGLYGHKSLPLFKLYPETLPYIIASRLQVRGFQLDSRKEGANKLIERFRSHDILESCAYDNSQDGIDWLEEYDEQSEHLQNKVKLADLYKNYIKRHNGKCGEDGRWIFKDKKVQEKAKRIERYLMPENQFLSLTDRITDGVLQSLASEQTNSVSRVVGSLFGGATKSEQFLKTRGASSGCEIKPGQR